MEVEKIVHVEKIVEVPFEKVVEKFVEKIVEIEVPRIEEKVIEIQKPVEKIIEVEKVVEKVVSRILKGFVTLEAFCHVNSFVQFSEQCSFGMRHIYFLA